MLISSSQDGFAKIQSTVTQQHKVKGMFAENISKIIGTDMMLQHLTRDFDEVSNKK